MPKAMTSDLRQQIAKATAGSGPSLIPRDVAPPPPREEEEIPDLRELVHGPDLRKLSVMIEEHCSLGEQVHKLDKERNKLTTRIKDLLGQHEVGKAVVGDILVNYFNVPRSTIKKELLLAHGVSPQQIAASTEVKDAYTLRISRIGEGE